MDKKSLILIFSIIFLLTLNCSVAQEIDNSTCDNLTLSSQVSDVTTISYEIENQSLKESKSLKDTHIDVVSNTTFDVVGDYFKVKLLDNNNKSISNSQVTFSVNGTVYKADTSSNGIASLQIRLKDGSYKIITKFPGNSNYKSCSKTTWISVNNTRIVKEGLSNAEIQEIIDNAKSNNIILFEGTSYNNVNLVINKRLTLISKSNTVLNSNSKKPVISVTGKDSSHTVINGFNIQGNGNGIEVKDSNYVTIINNDITTKTDGISALNVNNLNITKNNIVKNGNNGITLALANNSHIYNNNINSNGLNGIVISKSNKLYIYSNVISKNSRNGILTTDEIGDKNYTEGPKNLYITKNTINSNRLNGIFVYKAGDNINIKGNDIEYNSNNGISLTYIGSNAIQSNVISHSIVGLNFNEEYFKPNSQEISYNVIHHTSHVAIEARDSYYYDFGEPLSVGDNWFTDDKLLCPKVRSNSITFKVNQIGPNMFQASFYDSMGNIASLLPDRELTYQTNDGKMVTMTISGGVGVFTVDANDGDLIKATVDDSHRNNVYEGDIQSTSNPQNGRAPTYDYPSIQYDSLYDDVGGNGNGEGTGEGSGGTTNKGNGTSRHESSDNTGNSTNSQKTNAGSNSNNPVNDASQSDAQNTASQESASDSSSGNSGNAGSGSVVKQIIIDEDEFFRVTGMSFIVLLIILTIGFYYREDIKEMNSKR